MLKDALTVFRKELKEILIVSFTPAHIFANVVFIGIFGIFIPFSTGEYFLKQSSVTLSMYIMLLPLISCSALVADSFAGERERKTLESLLATRLSDASILTGKVLAVFVYSYAYLALTVFVSVLGANIYMIKSEMEGWFFYNFISCFALFVFTIPVIFCGTALGVFFSLKVKDLRTAQIFSRVGWVMISMPFISGMVKFRISWDMLIPGFYILFITRAVLLLLSVRFFRRSRLLS